MDEKTRQQVLTIFSRYYATAPLAVLQCEQREFGVGSIKKIDYRHLAFPDITALRGHLTNNPPLYVSHSTAYYRYPDATPIEKKEWLGSDLVFDLDLHAEEKYDVYLRLEEVKQDAIRLIEDFLLCDFGLEKKDLLVAFSGNRGYHVHVRHKDFIVLGSNERKELVDYIRGLGLNFEGFFSAEPIEGKRTLVKLTGPTPQEDGYRGRFARAVLQLLETDPASIAHVLKKPEARALFAEGIQEGNWSKVPLKEDVRPRLKPIAAQLPLQSVNADAGVTQDISKLIRVPNSIHGETGLVAKVVDTLDGFEPLRDALLPLKGMATVKFNEDIPALEFANETLGPFRSGEQKEVPRTFALFALLKGSAEVIG